MKQRMIALALGVLTLAIVFGVTLVFSNDVRLMYASGAVVLFCSALWLGAKGKIDWLAAALLVSPLVAGFGYLVLLEVPILWPHLLLWGLVVVLGIAFVSIASSRRVLAVGLAIAVFTGSFWYCNWYVPDRIARLLNRFGGGPAPPFTLQQVGDRSAPVAPEPGKILVIDFFSTSCSPCIAELPELAAIRNELSGQRDIDFVLVASDRGNDTPERFRSFIERRHITIPLGFDPGGKIHDSFGLHGVPSLVVIDRTGRVRLTRMGYNAAETGFRRDLVQFLSAL